MTYVIHLNKLLSYSWRYVPSRDLKGLHADREVEMNIEYPALCKNMLKSGVAFKLNKLICVSQI